MTPEEAYKQIAELAREHALIHQGYGGILVIVHPDTQKEQGIYEHVQWVHGLGPHPDSWVCSCGFKHIKAHDGMKCPNCGDVFKPTTPAERG